MIATTGSPLEKRGAERRSVLPRKTPDVASFLIQHFDRLAEAPGGIAKLRALTLQVAVSGKLPTTDLKEAVAEEYREETSDQLFPNNWRLLKFADHFDIQGGTQPPKDSFVYEPTPGYVRLFQIRDLGDTPVPTYIPEGSMCRYCKVGDILIGRYGASVGKIFWGQHGTYNVALAKFIFPTDAFVAGFVFLLLKSHFFQGPLANASRSAQAGFNKGDLAEIKFPLPPLAEQRRIVAKVEELMGLCDALEAAQREREAVRMRLRTSALHELASRDSDSNSSAFVLQLLSLLTANPEDVAPLRYLIVHLAAAGKLTGAAKNEVVA